MPPRAAPSDYQSQGKAGALTLGADFVGHFVPTPQGNLTTEDYVVVEVGIFGPPDANIKLFPDSFSLRVNGKKAPLPGQPYGMVFRSLKDPEWQPPTPPEKSKTNITGGPTGGGKDDSPPPPVHIPIEVQRAMQQRIQKASLPEGDRTLPLAGLLFFQYSGKTDGIRSIELIYNSPAGNVSVAIQP